MWCVYHYPAFKFVCHSWSNSFQQIMTMSINWTRASLQENRSLSQKITRSTKAVNSYTLPKKFLCCLHSDNSQLSTDYPQKRLSTSSLSPQRLVGTEKWSLNPNSRMQLQTNHCKLEIHFGRASQWPNLYGNINKEGSYCSGKCIWVWKGWRHRFHWWRLH